LSINLILTILHYANKSYIKVCLLYMIDYAYLKDYDCVYIDCDNSLVLLLGLIDSLVNDVRYVVKFKRE